jgi:Fe-S-cluster containining protein
MSAQYPDLRCSNCVAACCKGPVDMHLTTDEYRRHRGRMNLEVVVKPRNYPQVVNVPREFTQPDGSVQIHPKQFHVAAGKGLYKLLDNCGYLGDDDRCTIYETRPGCCRGFEESSEACRVTRLLRGLDGGVASLLDDAGPAGVESPEQQERDVD